MVVVIAFFGPTALLALIVGRLWTKLETWSWRQSIQEGLASVSVGLLLAGTLSMAKGAVAGWTTGGVALSVLLIMMWRKINPALLVLGGAIVGGIVFMPK
jgi:chromate transporter